MRMDFPGRDAAPEVQHAAVLRRAQAIERTRARLGYEQREIEVMEAADDLLNWPEHAIGKDWEAHVRKAFPASRAG